jgi:NAD(P)-dependent dehydrogenase (short-subunit alcohol dehydrogenase family)
MSASTKKIALVTGANKGIGFEIARQLAQAGLFVYLGCRDAERGKQAAAKLRAEGLEVEPVVLDVTDEATIQHAVKTVEEEQKHLDVLVNNAGIATGGKKPSETPLTDIRSVFETNFFGPIATMKAFLPLLEKSPAGRIVNVSSTLGSLTHQSDPNDPFQAMALTYNAYNESKSALNAATVQFANELRGTKIKVNAICPGYVATDLNNHSGPRTTEQGAKIAVKMALIGEDGPTAGYFDDNGVIPW